MPDFTKLPFMDVTVRLYKTSEPVWEDEKTKSRRYFATLTMTHIDISSNGKNIAAMDGGINCGTFVRFLDSEGEKVTEWYLDPEVLFRAIKNTLLPGMGGDNG